MKLIILKTNLVEALGTVERAIGGNVNLPILKNVLIETDGNRILMRATDLELAVQHVVAGKIIEPGGVTVPFAVLHSIVKNLAAERIALEHHDHKLAVTTENYEAQVQGQEVKEFPIIPPVHNQEQFIKIAVKGLRDGIESVIAAAQYSSIRPEISGVYLECNGGGVTLVATDSFRLAEYVVGEGHVHSTFNQVSVIIPLKTAEELLRILMRRSGDVTIFIDSNQIFFTTESDHITSRLIDGTFPEYKAIIPKVTETEVTVDRQELVGAVKLISAFSGRANDVTLSVGDSKKILELRSSDAAIGENRYRIPAKLHGEAFSISFNWRYLLDGLKAYHGSEVTIGVTVPNRPVVVKAAGEASLTYVLMPITT